VTSSGRLAALTGLVLSVAACQVDGGSANCELTQQVVLAGAPGSPLLLSPNVNVRLDQIGDGFFLLGSDGATVRWASLAADGTLGPEQAFALPAGATNPVYAVAGLAAPGDTVLVGYLATGSGGQSELDVIAVAADGSRSPTPANPVVGFPAGGPPLSKVAMMSSRVGSHAGLAWVDPTANRVTFTTIDGGAQPVGVPSQLAASTAAADPTTVFDCLGFSPGVNDLTVTYIDTTTDQAVPATWVIAEANEAGVVNQLTTLTVGDQMGCAVVTPRASKYALAWNDNRGSWLAVSAQDATTNQVTVGSYEFASASDFGGPDLEPPLVGLAPFGTSDFGVALARAHDVELWRLDAMGNRQAGALVFPTLAGNLGSVSALPVATGLVATYADYASTSGASTPVGRRLLVNAVCY
jgi:hypothetical protein